MARTIRRHRICDRLRQFTLRRIARPSDIGLASNRNGAILIGLEKSEFIFPADRTENYTIIEISMFEGRSIESKKSLIRLIFANIERDVGIAPQDVEITINGTPKLNWGIRGLCGDELALGYKVNV